MKHAKLLGFTAIILWLTNLVHLWPLPPVEAAQTIQLYQGLLAQPPQSYPDWNERPEWERKRTEEMWQVHQEKLRQEIAEESELEIALWIKWCARFTLIAVAIAGWLSFALHKLRWKKILPATTLLLVTGYAIFNTAVYSEISIFWNSGSMLLRQAPWQLILPLLNFYLVPILLAVITIAALFGKEARNESNQTMGTI